jgi:hypothetical protein
MRRYLREAQAFYDAIRARGYYDEGHDASQHAERTRGKHLRYLARYTMVAMLLQLQSSFVESLAAELAHHGQGAGTAVAQEARQLLRALVGPHGDLASIPLRFPTADAPPHLGSGHSAAAAQLRYAALVSSNAGQARFATAVSARGMGRPVEPSPLSAPRPAPRPP